MMCTDLPRPRWSRLLLACVCVAVGAPALAQTSPAIERIRELIRGGQYREAEAAARPLAVQDGSVATDALDALVESLWRLGRHQEPETLTLARRAVTLRESEGPAGEERLGNSVLSLAIVHSHREEYPEAGAAFERALALRERTLGPQHKDVGRVLNAYGVMLTNIGAFDASRKMLARALAISEAANGPDSVATAVVLTNIGNVLYGIGDLTTALPIYERVLDICQREFPQGHPYVTTGLNNVAGVLETMGDSAAARPFYEEALALNEKMFGSDSQGVALDLQNLGFNLMSLGDYAAARKAFVRALAIRKEKEANAGYAYTLAGLGSLLVRTGEHAQARDALEKALPLLEGGLGPRHPRVAEVLAVYGDLLAAVNDTQGASGAYERVISIWQEAFGPAYRKLSDTRRSLAWVLLARGDAPAAAREAARAEEERRRFIRDTIRLLPERQALALAAGYPPALDVQVAASTQAGGVPTEELLDAVIRSRALVLDEMASRHRVAFGNDAATQALAGRYAEARRKLANLLVRSAANESPDEHLTAALLAARRESEAAERELAGASVEFRAEQGRARAGLAEVKAALPPDSVLVSLIRHATGGGEDPPHAYAALVLRSDAERPALLALGGAKAIDDAVQKWRARLLAEGTAGIRSRRSEVLLRREGAALRAAFWDPVVPHLAGAARVFVVMDGPLHLVSLAALPLDAKRYLVEAPYEIHYLSAERDLLLGGDDHGAGLLAVGGPAYDRRPPRSEMRVAAFRGSPPDCKPFAAVRFTPLPGSLAESRQVARTFPSGSPSTILAGASASEAAFKAAAPGRRVLHLATHGFVLGGSCALAAGTRAGGPASGVTSLTLSGLAFAGANRRASAPAGQDDGILTGEEAAALDLRGVEWTVLSACDTGLGERTAGEGVLGLRRAFQVAGARTVITSLWPVEDDTSLAWMTALYRHRYVDGLSTSASVRQASLDRLRALRAKRATTHPFYWAAFVAVGDWR